MSVPLQLQSGQITSNSKYGYTLQGTVAQAGVKGIVIQSGKKIVK